MKIKSLLFVGLTFCIQLVAFAQSEPTLSELKQQQRELKKAIKAKRLDSLTLAKYEFGLNISPLASFALGAVPVDLELSATAKFRIGKQSYLRFTPQYTQYNLNNDFYQTRVVAQTDSTEKRQHLTEYYYAAQMGVGFERRIPKNKYQLLLGFDLFYRYGWQNVNLYSDSVSFKEDEFITYFEGADDFRFEQAVDHSIGIQPFFGVWFELAKHFSIAATFHAEFSLGKGDQIVYNDQFELRRTNLSYSYFQSWPLISDLVLSYKF